MWKFIVLAVIGSPAMLLGEQENLNAPPVVTAKAWALMDVTSGQVLHAFQGDLPLKAASTTKAMCLLVVLNALQKDPSAAEDWIKVSAFAAATKGSRAELTEGEQIQLPHALYAMMLPSGNDMANALAEHFNARFAPPGKESPASLMSPTYQSRAHFIAEMNRTALQLGMHQTQYRSALGDGGSAEDPTTTAHDLLLLTRAAMQWQTFRQIVATPRYEAAILMPDGSKRIAQWENTNELLKLDNYDGVKTGNTDQAGACLIASGHHQNRHLFLVLLGSANSAARYADARNLFIWAWRQPQAKPTNTE